MKDLTAQRLQAMIARKAGSVSPKSIRNLIALLGMMWNQAKSWGYVQHDPFSGLVLPERDPLNERCLTLEEMRAVIKAANEPYKTYFWILAETGVRAGEIGALTAPNLLVDMGVVRISQSVWHGKIQTVKSKKGQSYLRNLPASGGASSRIRPLPETEPFGSIVRVQEWNPLGYGHDAETQTLSPTEEAGDRALRISRLSSW